MALLLCSLLVFAIGLAHGQQNIPDLIESLGLTELAAAGQLAGLNTILSGPGPFTVLAPTNEAIFNLPEDVRDRLVANTTELTELLFYHIHLGRVDADSTTNDQLFSSLQGTMLRINVYNNGVSTVTGAMADKSRENQVASNGIVHVLNQVIYPIPMYNLVDFARNNFTFSQLSLALQEASLTTMLEGPGPYTIFAPTNDAVAKIPEAEQDRIVANITLLTSIIKYHITSSTEYSAGLTNGQELPTLNGKSVMITMGSGMMKVGDATIEEANLSLTNGVLHVIDTVLMPPTD